MGGGASEQRKGKQNEWTKYESELAADKISEVEPFMTKQLQYLEELFASLDKKNMKSLQLKDFEEITYLRDHPLFPRFREMFDEEMKKTKAKRINFQLFLYLLSVFHVNTQVETKYKYIFRVYDCDKNLKVDGSDLNKIYRMLYKQPFLQEEDFSKLVTETLIRFGNKGQIKLENMMEWIPQNEVKEVMSFRFNKKFV